MRILGSTARHLLNSAAVLPWLAPKNKIGGASPSVYADFGRDRYAMSGVGPNLVTNGDFSNGLTGWTQNNVAPATWSVSGGQAVVSSDGSATARLTCAVTTVTGRVYAVTSIGTVSLIVGSVSGGNDILTDAAGVSRLFVARGATTYITGRSSANGAIFDNVIVREVYADFGPNLVQNGDFTTSLAGWTDASTAPSTVTWSGANGGQALFTSDATNPARLRQQITTIPGRTYVVSSTGNVYLTVGTTPGASDILPIAASTTRLFVAVGAATHVSFYINNSTNTIGDNVVVREVLVGYGPELVTNPAFDADLSGWTDNSAAGASMSWVNGRAQGNTDGTTIARLRQPIATVIGRTYRVSVGGTAGIQVGTIAGQADIMLVSQSAEKTFVATQTTTYLSYSSSTNGLQLDYVSVREILTNQPVRSVTFPEMFLLSSGAKRAVANDNTLKSVPANAPAIDYELGTARWLLEGAGTNLIPWSQNIENAAWSKANLSAVTVGAATAPDGTVTAAALVDNATVAGHQVALAVSILASTVYTVSVYAKADTIRYVQLGTGGAARSWANFDLVAGTLGDYSATGYELVGVPKIAKLANGWCRLSLQVSGQAGGLSVILSLADGLMAARNPPYAGTGQRAFWWGVQVEAGSAPSSYIATFGSQASRVTDLCAFSPLLNLCIPQQAVTMAYRANVKTLVAGQQLIGLASWGLLRAGGGAPAQVVVDGHSTSAVGMAASTLPGEQGVSIAWDTSGRFGSVNGSSVIGNANPPDKQMPPFYFGHSNGMAAGAMHALGSFVVWPLRGAYPNLQAQARVYA